MLFICYPKCSTCKKAKKFLTDHQIEFDERHIVEEKLSKDELKALYLKSKWAAPSQTGMPAPPGAAAPAGGTRLLPAEPGKAPTAHGG